MSYTFYHYQQLEKSSMSIEDFNFNINSIPISYSGDFLYLVEQYKKGNINIASETFFKNINSIIDSGILLIQDLDHDCLKSNLPNTQFHDWTEDYSIDERLLTKEISTRF